VLTLGLTTSTPVMGVALGRDGTVLAERRESTDRRHAERLLPLVGEVLADAGCRLAHVERIAVDIGPGLFTGLRVGLATVGGLARALGTGVVTAPSLLLVAAGAGIDGEVLAVIDARRGEVFCQRFAIDGPVVRPLGQATLLDPATDPLPALPAVGDGAECYRPRCEQAGATVHAGAPCPAELVRRADALPSSPSRVPLPVYLREPDARVGAWATRAS
jgi:tRNA threonylcarbamoyladenosine biosynthesis protein TsaB